MSIWIMLLIACFVSFMVGVIVNHRIEANSTPWVGIIRIDRSDPDGPHLFFESSVPIDAIAKEHLVAVTVKNVNLLPRK